MKELNRLGPQDKCPACGWRLDPDAYRCPKCLNYFCFKCRRRVQAKDPQYQCLNQQCVYYGKLLCDVCTMAIPLYKTDQVQEPHSITTSGVLPVFLLCATAFSSTAGLLTWFGTASLALTLWAGGMVFAGTTVFFWRKAAREHIPLTDITRTTYTTRLVQYDTGVCRGCIACKQPVEMLHS